MLRPCHVVIFALYYSAATATSETQMLRASSVFKFLLACLHPHRGPSHPFKIKERACFVFLAALFIFCARGTCGLLVQGLEPRF